MDVDIHGVSADEDRCKGFWMLLDTADVRVDDNAIHAYGSWIRNARSVFYETSDAMS